MISKLWLFPIWPLNALVIGEPLGDWKGVPVYISKLTWWPFSMGWGNAIIIHPIHIIDEYPKAPDKVLMPRKTISKRLLEHEYRHIVQQTRVSGIGFLLSYAVFWLVAFLNMFDKTFLKWYKAYRAVHWERKARDAEIGIVGRVYVEVGMYGHVLLGLKEEER